MTHEFMLFRLHGFKVTVIQSTWAIRLLDDTFNCAGVAITLSMALRRKDELCMIGRDSVHQFLAFSVGTCLPLTSTPMFYR